VSSKRWSVRPEDGPPAAELAAALGVSPTLAALLYARGCEEARAGERFLNPSLDDLHDPARLPDLERAAERIAAAIEAGEKICIHGDYDVDGVCSSALLTRALQTLGAHVDTCVPHRQLDGYDLQPETVTRLHEAGVRLIVTVDCGIVAHAAMAEARRLGLDVIVTDHHLPGPRLPDALAVVNPKRSDSDYPFTDLCGTGLAYKLAEGVVRRMGVRSPAFRTAYLDLVALATVADCMPLLDENRALVKCGLEKLRETRNPGLKALMEVAGVRPPTLNARALGFYLGPRINAVGRLDAAEQAYRLLVTSDAAEAKMLAERLDQFNLQRQEEQDRIFQEAIRQAQNHLHDRILVLASARWHPGIIGNVASRMAETQARPAVLIAMNEDLETARGSARSIQGYHIFDALSQCRDLLDRCGGHAAAAGFEMHITRLDDLRAALRRVAEETLPDDLLQPAVRIDRELSPADLTLDLARDLARLEPFGHGNPKPVFMTRALTVVRQLRLTSSRKVGADHLKLFLAGAGRAPIEAVFWRTWPRAPQAPAGAHLDLCYELELNHFNGMVTLQLSLTDFRPTE
jgi:single-stranded-DNA-specific exonuclease